MSFVIDVIDRGEVGMVRETAHEMQFVLTLVQATKYKTRRGAEVARCHIPPENEPTIREVQLADADKRS